MLWTLQMRATDDSQNVEIFICLVKKQEPSYTYANPTTAFWVAFIPTMNQLDSFLLV